MPYTGNILLVKVTPVGSSIVTVGVVTGLDIALQREGGTVVHYYGSYTGDIAQGGNRATFRVQRWFMSDTDTDLLFDLFDQKTQFSLTSDLNAVATSSLVISGCYANSWKLITGDANSIIGEEISGEGTGWTATIA
jgi:hypothetical protein